MKWIVGIDLRPGSGGGVRFARWLVEASQPTDRDNLVFVHVLEEEHLRFALMQHHLDEVVAAARAAAEQLVAEAGASGEIRVVQGITAEEALETVRAEARADGVVVGRAAGREGHHIVRLGRVARRLLRQLASPVAVVPPDLRTEELGDGPIVALTSLADDSAASCRLAESVAARHGRRLAVLHVSRAPEAPYLPRESFERALGAHRSEAERRLADWIGAHGLRADETALLVGSPAEGALEWAEQRRAPLLVCGSRQLSAAERIFQGSTASSLAATAKIPILAVAHPV